MKLRKIAVWTLASLAGLLFLLVFLGTAAYTLLLMPPIQQYALNFATKQLNSLLVGQVTVGRIRSNLISEVEMFDILAKDSTAKNDSISLKHIKVTYNLGALLYKRVSVLSTTAEGLVAHVGIRSDGKLSIPVLPKNMNPRKKKKKPSDWQIKLGTAYIRDVKATYYDDKAKFYGKISGLNGTMRFHKLDSMEIKAQIPGAYYESPWWRGEVDIISSDAILTGKSIILKNSYLKGSGTEVRGGGQIPFTPAGLWDLKARIRTEVRPAVVLYTVVPGLRPTGSISGTASWYGTMKNPHLIGSVIATNVNYKNFIVDTIKADGEYINNTARSQVELLSKSGGGTVSASIEIPHLMSKPVIENYSIEAILDRLNIQKLQKVQKQTSVVPGKTAFVKLTVKGKGITELPQNANLDVALQNIQSRSPVATISATLNQSLYSISGKWGSNVISGSGNLSMHGPVKGVVDATFSEPSLVSTYLFGMPVSGKLHVNANFGGKLSKLHALISTEGSALQWKNVIVDTVNGSLTYDGKKMQIIKMHAKGSSQIDSVARFFHQDSTSGLIWYEVSGAGPIEKINLKGNVSGYGIQYKTFFVDTFSTDFTLNRFDSLHWENGLLERRMVRANTNGSMTFSSLGVNTNNTFYLRQHEKWQQSGQLSVCGTLTKDSVDAKVEIKRLAIDGISSFLPVQDVAGNISGSVTISGLLKNPKGDARILLSHMKYGAYSLASVDGTMHLENALLTGKTKILLSDSNSLIDITSQIPLSFGKTISIDYKNDNRAFVNIAGESIEVRSLAESFVPGLTGSGVGQLALNLESVNGTWNVDGFTSIKNGFLTYSQQNVSVDNFNMRSDIKGSIAHPNVVFAIGTDQINVAKNRVIKSSIRGKLFEDTLHIYTGNLILDQGGMANVTAKIPVLHMDSILTKPGFECNFTILQFPLALLSPFLPEDMIRSGVIQGKGAIQVRRGNPYLAGSIGLVGGVFTLPDIEPKIGPINAQVALNGDSIIIKQISGKWGEGSIGSDGSVLWDQHGIKRMSVNVRARKLSIVMPDLMTLRVQSGDLRLSGKQDNYLISGSLNLGPSRYYRDVGVTDIIEQIQNVGTLKQESDPFLKSVSLQIATTLQDVFSVDMNLGNFEALGQLAISGTLAQPSFTGDIRLEQGYVLYLDRRFDIVEGSFNNSDPSVLNPNINLKAQTTILSTSTSTTNESEYIITLTVTGDLQHPELHLTSEPGLDEANIISVLTLGQPLSELGPGLAERVRSFAAERITGFGARKLEQLLGIDRIDLTGNLLDFQKSNATAGVPRLSITKRISSKLIVTYETIVGRLSQQRVAATYRLTPHVYLQGQRDIDGNSGVDLILRYSK